MKNTTWFFKLFHLLIVHEHSLAKAFQDSLVSGSNTFGTLKKSHLAVSHHIAGHHHSELTKNHGVEKPFVKANTGSQLGTWNSDWESWNHPGQIFSDGRISWGNNVKDIKLLGEDSVYQSSNFQEDLHANLIKPQNPLVYGPSHTCHFRNLPPIGSQLTENLYTYVPQGYKMVNPTIFSENIPYEEATHTAYRTDCTGGKYSNWSPNNACSSNNPGIINGDLLIPTHSNDSPLAQAPDYGCPNIPPWILEAHEAANEIISADFGEGADEFFPDSRTPETFIPHHNKRAKVSHHERGTNLKAEIFGNLQARSENVIDNHFDPHYPGYKQAIEESIPQTPQLLAGAYNQLPENWIFPVPQTFSNLPRRNEEYGKYHDIPQSSWSAKKILEDPMGSEVYEYEERYHTTLFPSTLRGDSHSYPVDQNNCVLPEILTQRDTESLEGGCQDHYCISTVYSKPTKDANEQIKINPLKYKPKPSIILFDLQTRGRFMAQPLINSEEMETFFDILEKNLKSMAGGGHPQDLGLLRQAVRRARMWVTYPFLGIIQLIHERAEAIPGNVAPLNLPNAINEAWVFLKDTLENWQKMGLDKFKHNISKPTNGAGGWKSMDVMNMMEELNFYMYVSWDDNSTPPDNHLWKLLAHWYTLRGQESTDINLNPKKYRRAIFELNETFQIGNVNPCLIMFDLKGDKGKRNLYTNLQERGEFLIDTLRLRESLNSLFEGVIEDLTEKFKASSDVDTKNLIRKAFRRMRSWMVHRFLGALQVIFTQQRLNGNKTRVSTLQEEVSDAVLFLKNYFEGFRRINPTNYSWIISNGHALCVKSIKLSDHSHVLASYMHHNKKSQPPSGPVMKLLDKWFSSTTNLVHSKTYSHDFHKVLLRCYQTFARLDVL